MCVADNVCNHVHDEVEKLGQGQIAFQSLKILIPTFPITIDDTSSKVPGNHQEPNSVRYSWYCSLSLWNIDTSIGPADTETINCLSNPG